MSENRILNDVKERIEKLNIFELRQVARAVGVHRPADGKKSRVTEAILDIARGVVAPEPPSSRGAPPKSQQFDEKLVADILTCREYSIALRGESLPRHQRNVMTVGDSAAERMENSVKTYKGVLDTSGEYAFLRSKQSGYNAEAVFVHESFINRFSLKYGDEIECRGMSKSADEIPGMVELISVNGRAGLCERKDFSQLTPVYPSVNVKISTDNGCAACAMADLFSPVALGQRAFISAPSKSGKTTLIKQIATGICANYPQIKVVLVILDARPEEITDFKRSLAECELFYTRFDTSAASRISTAKLAFEYAKRITEDGGDALVIFDGVQKLVRAYTSEAEAAEEVKKLLYCACNAEEGGSLTVISTLAQDMASYGEYTGIANMVISLSRELAEKRIFPAIDAKNSYADGDERFLTADELRASRILRAREAEEVVNLFNENHSVEEVLKKVLI